MSLTKSGRHAERIRWAHKVCDVIRRRGDMAGVQTIEQAIQQYRESRFHLTVLGKAKRGKSTLLNAILGRHDDLVAPVDKLPASSAISRVRWAEQESAIVYYRDSRHETIPFSRIREFVTEELNPENRKGVEVVEVTGPFPNLDYDLELVDTPGAGSIHEYHDELLQAFIPQADAVIFLVTARMPLDRDEIDLLRKVKAADIGKIFFAVNRVDESTEIDIGAAINHNRKLLAEAGISVPEIHRISAKQAFQGRMAGSGVDRLLADIEEFLSANKGRVVDVRFRTRVLQAAQPVATGLAVEVSSCSKTIEELTSELHSLTVKKRSIEQERTISEREFQLAWEAALSGFESALKDAEIDVTNATVDRINEAALKDVSQFAKGLPSQITSSVAVALEAPSSQLEQRLRSAAEGLQTRYPTIEMQVSTVKGLRVDDNTDFLVRSLGGSAIAVTGGGLALAGSAAAASIAAANAAALAATTTVSAPSILASLLALVPEIGGVPVAGFLSSLATGTATVSAPAAITATPLWVAIAGPVGWTVAGVGLLAIPLAWRSSKLKAKDQMDRAARDLISHIFRHLRTNRLSALREMSAAIVGEFQTRLDRQIVEIEASLERLRDRRPSNEERQHLESLFEQLRYLLDAHTTMDPAA